MTFEKGKSPWNKGRKMPEETRKKISEAKKGNCPKYWKGKKFSKEHCENISKAKKEAPRRVEKRKDSHGYYRIHSPKHPYCDKRQTVFEHRLVMEKHIGRYLEPKEIVHHINSLPTDNQIENLMLFPNESAHKKFHHKYTRSYNAGG